MPTAITFGSVAARAFGFLGRVLRKDAFFNYVTMLLPGNGTNGAQNNTFLDSSTNNFTITRNGNTTQGTFSPYGANWSNYFPGTTGTWLSIANNAAFQFGTGDLTIEAWVCLTGTAVADPDGNKQAAIVSGIGATSVSNDFWFFLKGNTTTTGTGLYFGVFNGGSSTVIFNTTYTFNQGAWYHVAFSRSGNNVYLFINGALHASSTYSGTITAGTNPIRVGYSQSGTSGNYNMPFPGYISNVRIVKGTAVYTSAFTPSASPLTAITNTSLLTCQSNRFIDNSSNAFAVTVTGSPSVQRFSPFSQNAPYSSSVNGGSGYFDGTGDYLSLANNAAFSFGTGDFTIECWVYPQNTVGTGVFEHRSTSNGATPYLWYLTATNMYPELYTGTSYTSNISVPINAWSHIAISRQSGTLRQFVNGVQAFSGTVTTALDQTDTIRIMASNDAAQYLGYMSNMRVVKGTAVYTAAFTPPTAPLTAITNTQLLLSTTNAGIIDNAMMNDLETVGNAQISTTQFKFGGSSMYFDGNGDWLIMPSSPNLSLKSGNFTIEGWLYLNNTTGLQTIVAKIFDFGPYLITTNGTTLQYYLSTNGTSWNLANGVSMGTVAAGQWYHFALVRNGSVFTPYLNGVAGTTTTSASDLVENTRPVYVGGALTSGSGVVQPLNGYIDDLRITTGVARYTANFTPPTQAFPTQ